MTECGIPRELGTTVTQVGTNHFGGDGFNRSHTADCLPRVGGNWNESAIAGVFARHIGSAPSSTANLTGARAVRLLSA